MGLEPGDLVERYTVIGVVGHGGMAMVYKVRHNKLASLHALKVLTITSNAVKRRLLQEGQVQASLNHPNIVTVTDFVEAAGSPGLIMELVEGPTLEAFCREHRLTLRQVDQIASGIMDGVAEAHAHGLIHRDLKPANVMMSRVTGGMVPKVTDFGLVKVLSEDHSLSRTRSGLTMGTPRYMAPEQIRDAKKVDARADVFSLGAILYELVTRKQAFPGDDTLELFNAIDLGRFIPPREHRPDIPERMEAAILGALVPNREERIQSVAALKALWRGEARGRGPLQDDDPTTAAFAIATPQASMADEAPSGPVAPKVTPVSAGPAPVLLPSSEPLPDTEPLARPDKRAVPPADPAIAAGTLATPRSAQRVAAGLSLAALLVFAVGIGFGWSQWRGSATAPPGLPEAARAESAPAAAAAPASPEPVAVVSVAPQEGASAAPRPEAAPPRPARQDRDASGAASPPRSADTPSQRAESGSGAEPVAPAAPEPEAVADAPAAAAPDAADPAQGRVIFTGDARNIWLESAAGRFPAGSVPPGTYQVTAFFDGVDPVTVGSVQIAAGEERVLRCRAALKVCR